MPEPKWYTERHYELRPEPALYRLEAALGGQTWSLHVAQDMRGRKGGSPRRKVLLLPRHDAEAIRDILESHYGEGWTLVRESDP